MMDLPEQESRSQPFEGKAPAIPLKLKIEATWLARLDSAALQTGLREDFAALFADLGVPAEPQVEVEPFSAGSGEKAGILELWLDKEICHYPDGLLERALWLAAPDVIETGAPNEGLLARLQSLPSDRALQWVRLVCPEIVKIRPSALLTQPVLAAYLASLSASFPEAQTLPELDDLKIILGAVLDYHISIGDWRIVAQGLDQGRQAGHSPTEICESLIAALSPGVIEIQLAPESLQQITLRAAEYENSPFAAKREALFYESGFHLPEMRFVAAPELPPGSSDLRSTI